MYETQVKPLGTNSLEERKIITSLGYSDFRIQLYAWNNCAAVDIHHACNSNRRDLFDWTMCSSERFSPLLANFLARCQLSP
jgi:hypothetical protein